MINNIQNLFCKNTRAVQKQYSKFFRIFRINYSSPCSISYLHNMNLRLMAHVFASVNAFLTTQLHKNSRRIQSQIAKSAFQFKKNPNRLLQIIIIFRFFSIRKFYRTHHTYPHICNHQLYQYQLSNGYY